MQVDPRGPRFGAALTSVVLALVLATGNVWLLAVQTVVFAIGAGAGLGYAPYGVLYRHLIRPHLDPPKELEPAAPPRFAQGVGLVFAALGTVGYATAVTWLGIAATAAALFAALLNAAFGFCLGCELYLLFRRVLSAHSDREVHP
jgi:hypothetical protein